MTRVEERHVQHLRAAIAGLRAACSEWAEEFTLKRRAMNWGLVNQAYLRAETVLRETDHYDQKEEIPGHGLEGTMEDIGKLLTCEEAAQALGLRVSTIRQMIRRRTIDTVRPSARAVRIPESSIRHILEQGFRPSVHREKKQI